MVEERNFFVVGYEEIGLGIEAFNPRTALRLFLGHTSSQIQNYIRRELDVSQGRDMGEIIIPTGEIYPRQTALKLKTSQERTRTIGNLQIEKAETELAKQEIERLSLVKINVSPGLEEFIEQDFLR